MKMSSDKTDVQVNGVKPGDQLYLGSIEYFFEGSTFMRAHYWNAVRQDSPSEGLPHGS